MRAVEACVEWAPVVVALSGFGVEGVDVVAGADSFTHGGELFGYCVCAQGFSNQRRFGLRHAFEYDWRVHDDRVDSLLGTVRAAQALCCSRNLICAQGAGERFQVEGSEFECFLLLRESFG